MWEVLKNSFYAIGSCAGLFALCKSVFEHKYQRDLERINYALNLTPEVAYLNLESQIYNARSVPDEIFTGLETLQNDLYENAERVRFSGPLQKYFKEECKTMVKPYISLRELIQVNEWEPKLENNNTKWIFNKEAFIGAEGYPVDYASHLDDCVDRARSLVTSYQRLQILSETHFLETLVARWLLPRRLERYTRRNCS